MPFYPWLDELVVRVINHLDAEHRTGWSHTDMKRGAYFYRYNWYPFRLGNRGFTAFHIVSNIYPSPKMAGLLYCAARLETDLIPQYNVVVPQNIMNLFQQLHTEHIVPAEPYGHWPGALDIGVAPIALPAGFDPRLPNQNLPLNLWNEIHDTFLTNNPPLLQFLNAVP